MLDELHIPQHQALDGGLAAGNALKTHHLHTLRVACVGARGAIVADAFQYEVVVTKKKKKNK